MINIVDSPGNHRELKYIYIPGVGRTQDDSTAKKPDLTKYYAFYRQIGKLFSSKVPNN